MSNQPPARPPATLSPMTKQTHPKIVRVSATYTERETRETERETAHMAPHAHTARLRWQTAHAPLVQIANGCLLTLAVTRACDVRSQLGTLPPREADHTPPSYQGRPPAASCRTPSNNQRCTLRNASAPQHPAHHYRTHHRSSTQSEMRRRVLLGNRPCGCLLWLCLHRHHYRTVRGAHSSHHRGLNTGVKSREPAMQPSQPLSMAQPQTHRRRWSSAATAHRRIH